MSSSRTTRETLVFAAHFLLGAAYLIELFTAHRPGPNLHPGSFCLIQFVGAPSAAGMGGRFTGMSLHFWYVLALVGTGVLGFARPRLGRGAALFLAWAVFIFFFYVLVMRLLAPIGPSFWAWIRASAPPMALSAYCLIAWRGFEFWDFPTPQ